MSKFIKSIFGKSSGEKGKSKDDKKSKPNVNPPVLESETSSINKVEVINVQEFSTDELGIELAELWQQYLSFNAPEGNNECDVVLQEMVDRICTHYSSRIDDDPVEEIQTHVFQFTNIKETKYSIGYPKEFLLHFVSYFEKLIREDNSGIREHFTRIENAEQQKEAGSIQSLSNLSSSDYSLTSEQVRHNVLSCFKAASILTLWPNNNGSLTVNLGSEFQCFLMSLANNFLVYIQLQIERWAKSGCIELNDLPMFNYVLQIHIYIMQILVNSVSIEGTTIDDYLPMQPWSFNELNNISTGNLRITNKLDVKKNLHILNNLYTNSQMMSMKLEYFTAFVKEDCFGYIFKVLKSINKILQEFILSPPQGCEPKDLEHPEILNLMNLMLIIEAEALNVIVVATTTAPNTIPSNIGFYLPLVTYLSVVVSIKSKNKSITEALIIRICLLILRINSIYGSRNVEPGSSFSHLTLQPKGIACIFVWLHKQFDFLTESFPENWFPATSPPPQISSFTWLIFSLNYKRKVGRIAGRHDLWPWKNEDDSPQPSSSPIANEPNSNSFHVLDKEAETNLMNLLKNLQQFWVWDAVIAEVLGSQLLLNNRPQSSGVNIKINTKRIRYVFESFYEMFRDASFQNLSTIAFQNITWVPIAQLKFVHFISQVFKAAEAGDIFTLLNEFDTFRLLLGEKFLMANYQFPAKLDECFYEVNIDAENPQGVVTFACKGIKDVKYIAQFVWFLLHDRVMDYFHGLVIYSLYFQSSEAKQAYLGYEDIMLVMTQYSLSVARSTPASSGYIVYRICKLMINLYEIVYSMAVNGSKNSRDKLIVQLLETLENLMLTKALGDLSSGNSTDATLLAAASNSMSELLVAIMMPMGPSISGYDWIDLFVADDRMVNVDVSAEVQQKYLIMRKNLGKFRGTPSNSVRLNLDRPVSEKPGDSKERAIRLRSTVYPLLLLLLDESLHLTCLQIIQYIIVACAESILALDVEDIKAGDNLNRKKKQSYRSLGAEVVNLIFSFLSVSHKHPSPPFSVTVVKAGLNSLLYLLRNDQLLHVRIHIQEFIRRENLLYEFLKAFARSLYGFDSRPKSSPSSSNLSSLLSSEFLQSQLSALTSVAPQVEILRLGLAFLTSAVAGNDAAKNELRLLLQTSKEKLVSGRVKFATTFTETMKSSSSSSLSKSASKLTSLILCAEKSPAKDTIVVLLDLILECPLAGEDYMKLKDQGDALFVGDADRPKIRNTSVLPDYFQLIPSCSLEVQQFAIRSFINLIRGRASLINQNVCSTSRPKVIDIALDMMEVISEPMQTTTAELIELLGRHSVSVASLKHLFRKLQTDSGGRPGYAWKIIQALQGMFHQDPGPRHTFVFDGFSSGLRLPLIYRWPTMKGFSFCCWLRVESARNSIRTDNNITVNPRPKNYFPYILCLRDNNNVGLELFLSPTSEESRYKIVLRFLSETGESSNLCPEAPKLRINEGQWYFLAISLTPNSFYSKGEAFIKLNGFTSRSEFNFNKLPDNISEPTIGDSSSQNAKDYVNNTLRGQMGAMYFFSEAITEKQFCDVHALGPDYVYNFEPFSADYKDISINSANKYNSIIANSPGTSPSNGATAIAQVNPTFGILENGVLTSKILLAYNPVVLRGKYFLDNTPERNEIKWRIPTHVELSEEIKGDSTKYCNMHAIRLSGTYRSTTQDVRLAINSLGGIRAIIPLFAQIDQSVSNALTTQQQQQSAGASNLSTTSSSQPLITEYDPNFFPAVLGLFTTMVEENPENIIIFSKAGGFTAIRSLLDKASSPNFNLITFNQLIALYSRLGVEVSLQESCMENVLTNFKLWSNSPLDVQMTLFGWLIESFEANYTKFSYLLCSQRFIDAFYQYFEYSVPNLNNSMNSTTSSNFFSGGTPQAPNVPFPMGSPGNTAVSSLIKQNISNSSLSGISLGSGSLDESTLIASSPKTAVLANLFIQNNQPSHLLFDELKIIRAKLFHLIKLSIKHKSEREYEDVLWILKYLAISTNPISQQEILLFITDLLQSTTNVNKRYNILLGLLYGNFFSILEILYCNSFNLTSPSPSNAAASMTSEPIFKATILWSFSTAVFYLQLEKKAIVQFSKEIHAKFGLTNNQNNNKGGGGNSSTVDETQQTAAQQQPNNSGGEGNSSGQQHHSNSTAPLFAQQFFGNSPLDFQPIPLNEVDFHTGGGLFAGFNNLIQTFLLSSDEFLGSNNTYQLNIYHIIFSILIGKVDSGLKDFMLKKFPNNAISSGGQKYLFSVTDFENIQSTGINYFLNNTGGFGSIEDKMLVFSQLQELSYPSIFLIFLQNICFHKLLKEDLKQELLDDLFNILYPRCCEQIFSFQNWYEIVSKSLNYCFNLYLKGVSQLPAATTTATPPPPPPVDEPSTPATSTTQANVDHQPAIYKLQKELLPIAVTASKLLRITCHLASTGIKIGKHHSSFKSGKTPTAAATPAATAANNKESQQNLPLQYTKIEYSTETKLISATSQNDLFAAIVREERGYGSTLIKELIHSIEMHVQDSSMKFYIVLNILIISLMSLKEVAQQFYSSEFQEDQLSNFSLVRSKNLWILGMTIMELFEKLKSLLDSNSSFATSSPAQPGRPAGGSENETAWLEELFVIMTEKEEEAIDIPLPPSPSLSPSSSTSSPVTNLTGIIGAQRSTSNQRTTSNSMLSNHLLQQAQQAAQKRSNKSFPHWFIRFNQFLLMKIFYFNALNDSVLFLIKNYLDFFYLNHIDYANIFSNYYANRFNFNTLENKFRLECCFQNVIVTTDYSKLIYMESNNEFIIGNNLWLALRLLLKYVIQFHDLLTHLPHASSALPSISFISSNQSNNNNQDNSNNNNNTNDSGSTTTNLSVSRQENMHFLISLFLLSHNLLKKTIAKNSKLYFFESMYLITVICKVLLISSENKKIELLTIMLSEYIKITQKEYNGFIAIFSQLSESFLFEENSFLPSFSSSTSALTSTPSNAFARMDRNQSMENPPPNLMMMSTQNLDSRLDLISKILSGMLTSSQIEGFLRYHHVDANHYEMIRPSAQNIELMVNTLECNGIFFPVMESAEPLQVKHQDKEEEAPSPVPNISTEHETLVAKKYALWSAIINYVHEFGSYMEEELLLVRMMELGLKDQLLSLEGYTANAQQAITLQTPPQFNRPFSSSDNIQAQVSPLLAPTATPTNLNYDLIAFISVSESRRLSELVKQLEYNVRRSEKRWIRIFSQLANERGPWGYTAESRRREVYWTLDGTENDLHLKMKLKRNPFGTRHALATLKTEGKESFVEESNINNDRLLLSDLKKYKKNRLDNNLLLDENMDDEKDNVKGAGGYGSDNEDENADDQGTNNATTVDLTTTSVGMFEAETLVVAAEVITSATNSSGGKTVGKLECSRNKISFQRQFENKDFDFANKTGNNEFLWAVECYPTTTWLGGEVCGVYRRHYQLRYVAVEIFFTNRTSIFLNLLEKKHAKKIYRFLTTKLKAPNLNNLFIGRPKEAIHKIDPHYGTTMTQAWVSRKISNFEYLVFLNFVAGRTFNDLAQYPVFPWILSDYSSTKLDLRDPSIFRNFERPIGAQTESQRELMIEKYESCLQLLDDGIFPYHTGSHYSTSAMVIWYLIRMEPFTSYHVWLQDGKFDRPDRLFYSIQHTYQGCISNSQDVKELIPEFFYNPEFLYNVNNCSLGHRQTHEEIGDVHLPPWARDASEFIRLHREALESEYVSQNLHHWIDLIFGCRQRPPFLPGGTDKSVESCNVFVHLSYLDAVDLESMKASDPILYNRTIRQIDSYGQTPIQLFTKEHPKRKTLEEIHDLIWPIASVVLGAETKPKEPVSNMKAEENALDKPTRVLCYNEFKISNSPVVFITEILQLEKLITVDSSRILGYHTFQRRQPDNVPPYVFKLDRVALSQSSGGQYNKPSSKSTITSYLSYSANQREKVIGIPFAASVVLSSTIIDRPATLDNEIENLIGTRNNKMKYNDEEAKLRGLKRANELSMRAAKTPPRLLHDPSTPSSYSGHTTHDDNSTLSSTPSSHSSVRHLSRKPTNHIPFETINEVPDPHRSQAFSTPGGPGNMSILSPSDALEGALSPMGNNLARREKVDEHVGPHLFSFLTCSVTIASIPSVTKTFQYIFSCGHWDNTFKITQADTGRLVQSLSYHREVVTCITTVADFGKYWVIVGSKDCTITVWELFPERESEPVNASPTLTLYGHDDAINCLAANAELDIIASGSDDGTIILHTLRDGTYLRSITFGKLTSLGGSSHHPRQASSSEAVTVPNPTNFSPQQLDKDNYRVHMLVISKEGQVLAYSHDGYMLATYSVNGRYLRMISVREKLYTMCLSEDGRVVLTGGERGLIVLRWVHNLMIANNGPRKGLEAVIDGSHDTDFEPFPSAIRSMTLTSGEQHLIVGLESGEIRILAQDSEYLRRKLHRRLMEIGILSM